MRTFAVISSHPSPLPMLGEGVWHRLGGAPLAPSQRGKRWGDRGGNQRRGSSPATTEPMDSLLPELGEGLGMRAYGGLANRPYQRSTFTSRPRHIIQRS